MPRQARIDNPGLLQHVIARGVNGQDIFLVNADREDFVQRPSRLLDDTETHCYAWALLDNHFHLLLTPMKQPLANLMRRLLTGYATAFNIRHKRSGHLFQNRYKSIVCDKDNYLMELIRYIHLNPLRSGLVADFEALARYRWSGHRQWIGNHEFNLVKTDTVLSFFARRRKRAVSNYLKFLEDGTTIPNQTSLARGGRLASQSLDATLTEEEIYDERILGGGDFVNEILGNTIDNVKRTLTLDQLIAIVAEYCDLEPADLLLKSRKRDISQAKALVCYLATGYCAIRGKDVAERFNFSGAGVCQATHRGKELVRKKKDLLALLK
ncbi:transposase [Geothermobacter hydrogeniphilus]|uniref:Transposase n=1 Tax=Geothermobacter hydrogeniphilus TaxID=1969733 RepID=A0A2K2H5T4_9BACT|nr:transposase [Geothermobacter hydrogeniphilus]PNU18684.1 transposase [Geothermobacter hydrogeniphilus]